ncbi:FAD-binding oxidoreductase [Paenibacillus sp. NEAU-GSW1]|uniref:NAD(P)/FAD-dependent oxidoreductase n=1 Tax=Paenibacillus sp. NEAU-GSW1 TaxID=2682486 RepID=UPI0012E1A14C|nr:FAD-dependent oxidoreductase [Paenibacillus sp. NEAU-GSW1]MUT68449.1 FAD-dependent oxidoreductase [Paenibacillus sp. NEAU-GSW1]
MKLLHTGELYWPTTLAAPKQYEPLRRSIRVNAVIVGGGMSGIICGHRLVNNGLSAVILERNTIAGGSSSASTGLLQYSNDVMLCELIEQIGEQRAVQFYSACRDAVGQFGQLASKLPIDVGFQNQSSLYYASSEQDLPKLMREYETLHKHGFAVERWSADDISRHFPFRKPGAIITHGDAEINPYRFIHALADNVEAAGLHIYEHTDVVSCKPVQGSEHRHCLLTSDGCQIEADHIIFTVGYEPEELAGTFIKAELNRSYAAVTVVQDKQKLEQLWHQRYMIWETARPYLYMRTSIDNRIIIGGLDEQTAHPIEGEKSRQRRIERLSEKLAAHFPQLDAVFEYEWSATFGESKDNLPFIGQDPAVPGLYYGLGYGGNGSVYSMVASQLLTNLILGKHDPIAEIVRLDRPSLLNV